MKNFLLWFTFLLLAVRAEAATITAASTSRADVGTAVNSASDGDIVVIPSGTGTWTNTLYITNAITLMGSGFSNNGQESLPHYYTWGTTIEDALPSTAPDGALIGFYTKGTNGNYRLSQLKFSRSTSHSSFSAGSIQFGAVGSIGSTNCRIDHCFFNDLDNRLVQIVSGCMGVADHNWFKYSANHHPLLIRNGNFNGGVNGNDAWETNAFMGTYLAWYVEDCFFSDDGSTYVGIADSWLGGRYVIRNCYGTNAQFHFSNHGTESSQNERSGRLIEAYRNRFVSTSTHSRIVEYRGGTGVQWSNSYTMTGTSYQELTAYRVDGSTDPWWYAADGTIAWDEADLTDGAGTPGGAGDGVFESGTSTAGGLRSLTDSGKSWTVNGWEGYILRAKRSYTASSTTANTVTVSGAGWTVNEFDGYTFTDTTSGAKGMVNGNTSDTITFSTSYAVPNTSSTTTFELSISGRITANTATVITIASQHDASLTFPSSIPYEIRRVTFSIDQPGASKNVAYSPRSKPAPQDISQRHGDPLYCWGVTKGGSQFDLATSYYNIQPNRDFFNQTNSFNGSAGIGIGTASTMSGITGTLTNVGFWVTDEGEWDSSNGGTDGRLYVWSNSVWTLHYTPYTYPHPLVGASVATTVSGTSARPGNRGQSKRR